MTEESGREQAVMLAEMAPHESVTVGVLADEDGRLGGDPPVTYLDGTEAPAYALTNGKRGIGVGTKRNCTEPDGGHGTVILVTDRRTLCLVGQSSGDVTFEIEHDTVAGVDTHTGLIANRLVLETPRKRIHCWINRRIADDVLDDAAAYVRDRLPETPLSEVAAEKREYKAMYRGKPIARPEDASSVSEDAAADGGPAVGDRSDDETADGESDEKSTVTYRGKEVDPSYLE